MIVRMKEHVEKHGPLPHNRQKCIDPKLVFWSRYVRSHILKFSKEQLEILLEAGFFNYREEEWLAYYWKLCDFASEHGHCRVPESDQNRELKRLGRWAYRQRKRRAKLRDFQIVLLGNIEFEWELLTPEFIWRSHFEELKAYMAERGDFSFRRSEKKKYSALSQWVTEQRRLYARGELSKEYTQRLNSIGFSWDPLNERWNENVEEYRAFKKRHGHDRFHSNEHKDTALATWVNVVRSRYQRGDFSPRQFRQLDALGFCWDSHGLSWEQFFEKLAAYAKKHRKVRQLKVRDIGADVFAWANRQRKDFKTLSENQRKRLDALFEIPFLQLKTATERRDERWQ